MSDTYSVADYMAETGRQARAATIGSFDDDPEQATRAIELGDSSGAPASAIYPDVEGFERAYKSTLASNLIQNNPKLSEYLLSHPMASKISHDDLGALDQASQSISAIGEDSALGKWLKSNSIQRAVAQAAKAMVTPPDDFGKTLFQRPNDIEWAASHPLLASVVGAGSIPMEVFGRIGDEFGAGIEYGHAAIEKVFGKSLADDLAGMAQYSMMRGDMSLSEAEPPLRAAIRTGAKEAGMADPFAKAAETIRSISDGLQVADIYNRTSVEPPPGVHPLIDEAKKLQAKEDIDTLNEALKDSIKSATRERSPELFANFVRSHLGDREIGIDSEAVAKLYGDKIPAADDNLLGWVPGLADTLRTAQAIGADIRIPLADWLARVDPEVADTLHDDIRVRDAGMTINETKIEAEPKTVIADPVATIRGAAGLEPMLSVGDRKVLLQLKQGKELPGGPAKSLGEFHDVDILDETGKAIGTINISMQKGGRELYIDMIQAGTKESRFYQPNFLGPALVRDIKRQLKQMFPNAETITGHRVSGARERAGVEMTAAMPVVKLDLGEDPQSFRDLLNGMWEKPHEDVAALFSTNERGLAANSPMGQIVLQELRRIAPGAESDVAHGLEVFNKLAYGAYLPNMRQIIVSLESKDPLGTAGHEAVHFLREAGMFTDSEWRTLEGSSLEHGWVKKYKIDKRYAAQSQEIQHEEGVAHAYQDWRRGASMPPEVHTIFERIKQFFQNLLDRVQREFGLKGDSWEDIFKRIESGEIGARETPEMEQARLEGGHEPFAQRPEDLFEKGALGVTEAHKQRMLDLIAKRNEEDLARSQRRAETRQRQRSNREWKERRTVLRDEVSDQLSARPDLATDDLFARGTVKLHPDHLTEDQKARLPRDYLQKKNGIAPDDLAPYFGYTSGDALVERLGMLTEDRRRSGMSARDYFNRLVDVETDRRLNEEFGDREQRILDEAKDQALSETQLNLVHEETLAYALQAGQEPQFTKEQTKAMVRQAFDSVPVGQIASDRLLQNAGKIGKKIEEAASKGKWDEAYRLSQQRNYSTIAAKYAREYERARRKFDADAKTFRKREVPKVRTEYTNWVHDILQRVGYPVNRSIQDLAESIARQPETTLEDFMNEKEKLWAGMRELPVADFLLDPDFRKPINELSHRDFIGLKSSVDALIKAGRDEDKIYRFGESMDRETVLNEMKGKLATFALKGIPATRGYISKKLDLPRSFIAGSTNIETLLNRWDRDDPRGIFNRYITYPLAKASNYKNVLEREMARALDALGKIEDKDKLVDSPITDPLTRTEANPNGSGTWEGFRRNNVMAMLQNAGNKSNWNVLAKGYSADPVALRAWLERNITKADVLRAQKLGDTVFKRLVREADDLYERMTGATIEKVPLEPITFNTRDGPITVEGWYHPLIRNSDVNTVWEKDADTGIWSQRDVSLKSKNDDDFFHYSTANGYTKKRTGATYPLELDFNRVPARMRQMIHDIAFKEVIHETRKIFENGSFQDAVTKHYGSIYKDLLTPYLKGIAGAESFPSRANGAATRVSEFLRQNVISTLIGFNPYTAFKHGPTALVMSSREVGTKNFANAVATLYGKSPELGLSNSEFAMKYSEELQRRERHWQDTISGVYDSLEGDHNWRQKIIEKGSWLVAQSDMFSAKPTWLAAYEKAIADGSSHGEAIELGDRAVRRAHGSTAVTNQPALVRGGGAFHGWLTSVYGFFGTNLQRRIEIAHDMKDTYDLAFKDREFTKAANKVPGITADIMTYVIWPTLVEEAVTSLTTDDRRGWLYHAAAATGMGLSTSWLYLRDLMHAATTGDDVSVGLVSSPLHDIKNNFHDIAKGSKAFNRQNAGKTVGHVLTTLGDLTGMAPKTIDNAVRFGIDLVNHQAHPKGVGDVFRGVTRGTEKRRIEK